MMIVTTGIGISLCKSCMTTLQVASILDRTIQVCHYRSQTIKDTSEGSVLLVRDEKQPMIS